MRPQFYNLRIKDLRKETSDTVSVAFEVPADIQEIFRFTQGQYLTLRSTIGGEDIRRSYSICTAPQEQDLRVAIKQVEGGVFSTWANTQLRIGDTIAVMPPQGRFFTTLSPENKHFYVAFAVGSGITPIISIIKTTLFTEPNSRFVLFYGNKSFDHIVFREGLEALKNEYPDRFSIHHVLSRESLGTPLFYGRIDAEKCRAYAQYFFQPSSVDACFICGPEEMVLELKENLESVGMPPQNIHFELFTTGAATKKKSISRADTGSISEFEAAVTVIQDGTQFDFILPGSGSNLLDAAMRAGADLPYSCKGGVCSTCKAKILEGEVEMEVNYGLEPDEIAAGYVLTCQAHPRSKRVVVSFD